MGSYWSYCCRGDDNTEKIEKLQLSYNEQRTYMQLDTPLSLTSEIRYIPIDIDDL